MAFDNTPQSVHIDQILTNLTLDYVTEQRYLADIVFPVVEVQKKSDEYYKFDPNESNRENQDAVGLVAPRTTPRKFDVSHGTGSYMAKVYGTSFDMLMEAEANEDEQLKVRQRKARQGANMMSQKKDRDFIATYMKTGVWGQDLTGVASSPSTNQFVQWNNAASTPIDNIRLFKKQFKVRNYGFEINKMVVTQDIVDALMANPQVLGRINGGATIANPALIDMTLLANIFGIEEIILADAVTNAAAVGATATPAFMLENKILFTHTPAEAGLDTPAAGLTFAWNAVEGVSYGISAESFTDDSLRRFGISEEVHMKMSYDMQLVGASMGTYVSSVLA